MKKQCNGTKSWFAVLAIVIVVSLISGSIVSLAAASERTGAWVDTVTVSFNDLDGALVGLQSGNLDIALFANPDQLDAIDADLNLATEKSHGLCYQLLTNPAGPFFTRNGKLNPFHVHKIREALNWLINREYISQTLFQGRLGPRYFAITPGFPDYVRYGSTVSALENKYGYDFEKAHSIISSEMINLGATLDVNNKWTYSGELVTLLFIIRNDGDGNRLLMGNYIADQLEGVGFTVDRQYMTGSQAAPIWIGSDPGDGYWHLYTGAWSATGIDRDQGNIFQEMYTPNSAQGMMVFQANDPVDEFSELADNLATSNYTSWAQRDSYFNRTLELAMEDSLGVYIADSYNFSPRRVAVTAAYDIGSGLSRLWPYTARFGGLDGGNFRYSQPGLFLDPWNPVQGSTWQYDANIMMATADDGLLPNPINGLAMPQRIASAVVTAREGLPMDKSSDWVAFSFAPTIEVPADAWVDWNASTQTFITAGTKFPEGSTALVKSVVTYPVDLFSSIKWHDGSPLDVSDFVAVMIVLFDRAKPESAIYDSDYAEYYFPVFMDMFKGVKIVATNPLIIETYTDSYYLDAELSVVSWWPENGVYPLFSSQGGSSPMPWHTTALAMMAEEDELLAFSESKAGSLGVEQTNYIHGPTLSILNSQLTEAKNTNYIPYANTLNNYIDASEATARWSNMTSWYAQHGHFWVGTGPFYLDDFNWEMQNAVLTRNPAFPDPSGKWDQFAAVHIPPFAVFLPFIKR